MQNIPTLNPDGWSVKGCSMIYAPRGQAGEYSKAEEERLHQLWCLAVVAWDREHGQ